MPSKTPSELKVEYVGHACLLVEAQGERFLTDPWFTNPVMANSWYHLPKYSREITEIPPLDFIYVSHEHADHLDIPALRQLTPEATILFPKYHDGMMLATLQKARLTQKLLALEDGEVFTTPQGNKLCINFSDTGAKDSSLVLTDGETCIYNHTDSWFTPGKMKKIGEKWNIDLAFQCYAGTGSFPSYMLWPLEYRIEVGKKKAIQLFERMRQTIEALSPKAYVPFAASFGYLRPENIWLNKIASTTPAECVEWLASQGTKTPSVVLNHGDTWTKNQGANKGKVSHSIVITEREIEEYSKYWAHTIELKRQEEVVHPSLLPHLGEMFKNYLVAWASKEQGKFKNEKLKFRFNVAGDHDASWSVDFSKENDFVTKSVPYQPDVYLVLTETEVCNALLRRHYTFDDLYNSARIQMNRYPYNKYHQNFYDSFFGGWDDTKEITTNQDFVKRLL